MGEPPHTTELQKLLLQNRLLARQLAEAQLETVVLQLRQPGYLIDLSRLDYVPAPAPVSDAGPQGE